MHCVLIVHFNKRSSDINKKQFHYSMKLLLSLITFWGIAALEAAPFAHKTLASDNPDTLLTRFTFGACWQPNRSQEHWDQIIANHPQFWLWLGDNIYANTDEPAILKEKYQELASEPGYLRLTQSIPVLATWDDHDFGQNDAGCDYPTREESENIFLDFFNEPTNSPRRQHPGVYTSYYFGIDDQRVQVILLDTRYFRSSLIKISGNPPYRRMGKWMSNESPDVTVLGVDQWKWLESELRKPARLRIIGSSIQFCAPYNGYETWANFPLERQRMIDLIQKTKAEGVVFLSGDIHSSELCLDESTGCYPLIDFTSSSLNVPLGAASTHRRLGSAFGGANFGVVTIDWKATDPTISFSTKDLENVTRIHHTVPFSKLTFDPTNLKTPSNSVGFAGTWQTYYGTMQISKIQGDQWSLSCADRSAVLKLKDMALIGTWKNEKSAGSCEFKLTRDGRFLKGAYSYASLPLQLDWAGWKSDWESHFTRETKR